MNISVKTMRNTVKRYDLKAYAKIKKPLLRARHIKQRLDFCKKYQNWTVEDWKRVIWSDEAKANGSAPMVARGAGKWVERSFGIFKSDPR